MIRSFPNTLRGRILLSQLGLFAVLLLALGIVQSSILSGYLHDSTVDSIREPARTATRRCWHSSWEPAIPA